MFLRIATSALYAGVLAGLVAGVLQLVFVQPILLHAELYELGELTHFGRAAVKAEQEFGGIDPARDGLSMGVTALVYTGYAFLLVAAMALATTRGVTVTARQGIVWGIAGFIAVQLAPGFGLPPEVPGVGTTDVFIRQVWWFCTTGAAAVALWLIAFGRHWAHWVLAVVLLAVPHVIGAPEPDYFAGSAPPELASLFASRALGVGLAAWVMVGALAGYFWNRNAGENAG